MVQFIMQIFIFIFRTFYNIQTYFFTSAFIDNAVQELIHSQSHVQYIFGLTSNFILPGQSLQDF